MAEAPDGSIWLAGVEEMTSFDPARLLVRQDETTIVRAPLMWWQHWWVWLLPVALLAIFIWRLSRYYEKRHNKRVMRRLQREKKQKELQMNAIRLKNIPHFHANVLAGIEYFIMNNSSEDAMRYLKLYSNFTNQILADIERPARTVDEEIENVKVYLELEKLRYGDRLTYTIFVDDYVNTETLLPTMLLHTYSQNAIKHGIGNKPAGGHIDISVRQAVVHDIEMLVVKVQDNGVGRAEAMRLNKNSTKLGLKILLEQIQLYNQVNQNHIQQQVTDLYDEQGRPNGTCFEMLIPVDYKF
jgi:LytS/YehU family sensor histidine kinase